MANGELIDALSKLGVFGLLLILLFLIPYQFGYINNITTGDTSFDTSIKKIFYVTYIFVFFITILAAIDFKNIIKEIKKLYSRKHDSNRADVVAKS